MESSSSFARRRTRRNGKSEEELVNINIEVRSGRNIVSQDGLNLPLTSLVAFDFFDGSSLQVLQPTNTFTTAFYISIYLPSMIYHLLVI